MELDFSSNTIDPKHDALYKHDSNHGVSEVRPWSKDPDYFTKVRVSAVALVKMVMHARSGGSLEVMGMMQGYVDGTTIVVTDAFRLPVEGTETRVNAQDDANEYLVQYLENCRNEGLVRKENAVGWYHSHPGYGCWLSGIDVATQHLQQTFNDPFVAVVIDPDRTVSANKVEIGAFRTYPEDHRPESRTNSKNHNKQANSSATEIGPDGYQSVPLNKAEDFGAHSSRYYSLEVEHFRSTLDSHLLELLWNKYWVSTLSQNPLTTNRDFDTKQTTDLAGKVRFADLSVQKSARMPMSAVSIGDRFPDAAIDKVVQSTRQVVSKERAGLMAVHVKEKIFGQV